MQQSLWRGIYDGPRTIAARESGAGGFWLEAGSAGWKLERGHELKARDLQ